LTNGNNLESKQMMNKSFNTERFTKSENKMTKLSVAKSINQLLENSLSLTKTFNQRRFKNFKTRNELEKLNE
jgi:hypothetical protein